MNRIYKKDWTEKEARELSKIMSLGEIAQEQFEAFMDQDSASVALLARVAQYRRRDKESYIVGVK